MEAKSIPDDPNPDKDRTSPHFPAGWTFVVGPQQTPLRERIASRQMLGVGIVLLTILLPVILLLVRTARLSVLAGGAEEPGFFHAIAGAIGLVPAALILGSIVALVRQRIVRPPAGRKAGAQGPAPPRRGGDPMRDRWLDS